jgi:hypothetical protein
MAAVSAVAVATDAAAVVAFAGLVAAAFAAYTIRCLFAGSGLGSGARWLRRHRLILVHEVVLCAVLAGGAFALVLKEIGARGPQNPIFFWPRGAGTITGP